MKKLTHHPKGDHAIFLFPMHIKLLAQLFRAQLPSLGLKFLFPILRAQAFQVWKEAVCA
jgi:hypothetical protein